MESETEEAPNILRKHDDFDFHYRDNRANVSNAENNLVQPSSSVYQDNKSSRIVTTKSHCCTSHDDDVADGDSENEVELNWTPSSSGSPLHFDNGNYSFTACDSSGQKDQCKSHNIENFQGVYNQQNVYTEQYLDWFDRIPGNILPDSEIPSAENSGVERLNAFNNNDNLSCVSNSEISPYCPDFSDICSENYSFWEPSSNCSSFPSNFSQQQFPENFGCDNISTPDQETNYNHGSGLSSNYYSPCNEETFGDENNSTNIKHMSPSYLGLFSSNTGITSDFFSVQNETKVPIENATNIICPVSMNDGSCWSSNQITSTDWWPKCSDPEAPMTCSFLTDSNHSGVNEMTDNLNEKLDDPPLCILESVYSIPNNLQFNLEQASNTCDDYPEKIKKTKINSNSISDAASQNEIVKIPEASEILPETSAASEAAQRNVLLLLKSRIPRATLSNNIHASAKLLIQRHKSESQKEQTTSTVGTSGNWYSANQTEVNFPGCQMTNCLPLYVHGSFQENLTESETMYFESPENSTREVWFQTNSHVRANVNQNRTTCDKQVVACSDRNSGKEEAPATHQWIPSTVSVTPISGPQVSVFKISPVQPKTVVMKKDQVLHCSTPTVDDPRKKNYHALQAPPPYIAVIKKSAVNSSKKQRQKTVRELLQEKQRKHMLDSLARQTIKKSGKLDSPVKFVTPLSEVSNDSKAVSSNRQLVAQSSTYTFSCDRQDCGKHLLHVVPSSKVKNGNQSLHGSQLTTTKLLSTSIQEGNPSSGACSLLNNTGTITTVPVKSTAGDMIVCQGTSKGTLPPFKAGRVNAKEHRPRHYDITKLQIGKFYVCGQESNSGRILSKFKIIFTKRYFAYEFPVPDSSSTPDETGLISFACIIVSFASVTAMKCENNAISIQVNCQPVIYLGSQQPRSGVISNTNVFDMSKTVDITEGEIRKCRVHEIFLKGQQANKVVTYLSSFDQRFEILLQMPISSSESAPLEILPLSEVCVESVVPKKMKKKGTSGYVRNPPWLLSESETTAQVCACRISCRSVRCSCVKAAQRCSVGRSVCLCYNCDNPLNILDSMGIDPQVAILDPCLFHNVYQVQHLRQFLTREIVLNCCKSIRAIKDCIPGAILCPNSSCAASLQYSWCNGVCCLINVNPPNHCHVCGKCRFNTLRHCEKCNKCYDISGNSECPKCVVL